MYLKQYSHLIDEIRKNNCCIFLGAGFAVPSGCPNWVNLLLKVAEKVVNEPSLCNLTSERAAELQAEVKTLVDLGKFYVAIISW
jgi:hypothetical protein